MDLTAAPSRVLVVDNDEAVSSLFARILSREGYTVETAANFKTARQLLERQLPDVILVDVVLPDAGGFSICKQLKDDASTRLIPVGR